MTYTVPVTNLKHYSEVLHLCDDGAVICLTQNGHEKYVIQNLSEYEKPQAELKLLAELSKGVESCRTGNGLTVEEAFTNLEG